MRSDTQVKMYYWLLCSTIFLASVSSTETVVRPLTDTAPIQSNTIQRIVTVLENKPSDETRALKKVFLSNRSITCNDGSQAGFYLRKSHTSKKWIIFLEGGWYCYDNHTCRNRWLKLRHLMTSSQWPETRDVSGILSPVPEENPHWYNANHVFVPYCTSDSWSGTRMTKEGMFTFMGALVVQQVILDLIPLGLDNSTSLLLAGSSAGGTGAMLNVDPVRELLHTVLRPRRPPTVRAVCDSGWFLDRAPYREKRDLEDIIREKRGGNRDLEDVIRERRDQENIREKRHVNRDQENIIREKRDVDRDLEDVIREKRDVNRDLEDVIRERRDMNRDLDYVIRERRDQGDIIREKGGVNRDLEDIIREKRDVNRDLKDVIRDRRDMNRDLDYVIRERRDLQDIREKRGVNRDLEDVIREKRDVNRDLEDIIRERSGQGDIFRDKRDVERDQEARAVEAISKGMDMWRGRVPKRCGRKYKGEEWRCYFGYRLYPTLKSPLFVFQWLFDEAQMTVDNVGAPVTKQQWDYIHKMGNALRQSFENVTAVFAPSCISHSVLTKRDWQLVKVNDVSIAEALHCWEQQPLRRLNIRQNTKNSPKTSDGPTVNKGSSVGAKISRTNDRRKKQDGGSTTESTNKRRRRKKHKNRDRDRNLRKNKRHKGRHNTTNTTQSPKFPPLRRRSHCHQRHLERCSWPQCNHSCPKLHNPFTGEEMDFIELLKSFGLDMESVATALGIDMQTLNNMDPGELLNLLTQQAN